MFSIPNDPTNAGPDDHEIVERHDDWHDNDCEDDVDVVEPSEGWE